MTLAQSNEDLAARHLQRVIACAINFRRTPIPRLQDDALRTARVEAKVLRDLATASGDNTLCWAADEADRVVAAMK